MNKKIPEDAHIVFSTKLFAVYQKEQEQFDGSYKTFEWLRTYDVVKAICIVEDNILLQYEEWPGGSKRDLPGGMVELNEDPDIAVKREVEEETGMHFASYEKLYEEPANIGLVEGYRHYYIARELVSIGEQKLDEGGEKIISEKIDFEKFCELVLQGGVFRGLGDWIQRSYLLPGKKDELRKILFG